MKITKIKVDEEVTVWVEPRFIFIGKEQYFFRELVEGGILIYDIDMDGYMDNCSIIKESDPIMKKIRDALFELQIGLSNG